MGFSNLFFSYIRVHIYDGGIDFFKKKKMGFYFKCKCDVFYHVHFSLFFAILLQKAIYIKHRETMDGFVDLSPYKPGIELFET